MFISNKIEFEIDGKLTDVTHITDVGGGKVYGDVQEHDTWPDILNVVEGPVLFDGQVYDSASEIVLPDDTAPIANPSQTLEQTLATFKYKGSAYPLTNERQVQISANQTAALDALQDTSYKFEIAYMGATPPLVFKGENAAKDHIKFGRAVRQYVIDAVRAYQNAKA